MTLSKKDLDMITSLNYQIGSFENQIKKDKIILKNLKEKLKEIYR
jgi:hypothetical protein